MFNPLLEENKKKQKAKSWNDPNNYCKLHISCTVLLINDFVMDVSAICTHKRSLTL